MDYNLLFAEAWPVELNPGQFRSDEARMQVLARTAGILGELEAAVRRELGAPTRSRRRPGPRWQHRIARCASVPVPPLPVPQRPAIEATRKQELHVHSMASAPRILPSSCAGITTADPNSGRFARSCHRPDARGRLTHS
jgi:hypothetical protein